MPNLRHAVRVGTGLDNVDRVFCQQAGIAVYNAPGANADAVAEYVLTVALMALRNVHLIEQADIQTWNRFKFAGHGIAGRRVGIVGFGHIGKLLYQKLHGLGCRNFLLHDPYVHEAPADATLIPLDGLLQHSDIISLHLPLMPQTQHCINAEKLAYLREHAILINASRGGVVDEAAVLARMQQLPFTYIADTVEGEPHVNPALLQNPNIIITPHIASLTDEAEAAMVRMAVQNLLDSKAATLPPAS
jgi:(S)-sulfolactate dehydrogenase